jgi:ribosome recycling factor
MTWRATSGRPSRTDKTIATVRNDFNTVRTGRANPSILDRIEVEYYGALTPLNTIANATTSDSQTIVIQPFDKAAINDIERAIMKSDLGRASGVCSPRQHPQFYSFFS